MQLQMLTGPETAASPGSGHVEISGLTADSREVQPGWLFAALPGAKADGARFVSDAIAKGAAAILVKAGSNVAGAGQRARAGIGRAASRAGPDGGALLRRAARQDRRRHRHQRQDLGGRLHAPDLRRARPQGRLARHHRPGQAGRQRVRLAHHARSDCPASHAVGAGGGGRHASRLRGVLARPRPASPRWRAHRRPRPSPTSAATISTTTRTWSPTSPPSCACSRSCCLPDGTAVVNADVAEAERVMAAARSRGAAIMSVGHGRRDVAAGGAGRRRLRAAHAHPSWRQEPTTCGCRCSVPIRRPTRCSPRASPSQRARRPIACSPRSRRCRASRGASRSPARRAAAWSSSTMRTSPMPWPRPSMRCVRLRRAGWCACSAAAATATRASVPSWARSPPPRPTA